MGNQFSNTKEYMNDPSLIICDAKKLQNRILKHSNNALIIPILEVIPVAANYRYDTVSQIAHQDDFFENFYSCQYPLWFHMGSLRFYPGCKIVLTKEHYSKILKLNKLDPVPLGKDDQIKILGWTSGHNFFI